MHETETITGYVDRLLFYNEENGFVVFVLQLSNKQTTTVKGFMATIHPGEQVSLHGSWVMHPKFGKQFEVKECTKQVPTSIIGLKKYLSSGLIKGIGPVYGEKLVTYFGDQVLEIIDKQPDRLQEIDGIGPKRVEKIIEAWKDQKEISHIMVFLQEKGISPVYATKIYKHYRADAITVILENPYRLAQDIWGIGFKMADQIAQNLDIAPDSIKRIKAGILHIINTSVSNGNLYSPLETLRETTATLLDLPLTEILDTIKIGLHELYNSDIIKLITDDEKHFITLSQFYFSEKGVALKIKKLTEYPAKQVFDIDAIYKKLRITTHEKNIILNEDQQRSILTCLQNKVTIITGGPGTGKTTLIKKLLSILDSYKVVYRLAAPTGRAAKRITEGTGKPASTIHRLLEFDVSTMGFVRNEQNALLVDFLIIDEASMIDIFLAHSLLKALPLNARLLLIGDIDQLPSVGAGNFLHDLIASKTTGYIRLTNIFRQAQDSLIITNAHRINQGEFPLSYKQDARRDFIFIKEESPAHVAAHLQTIYTKALPEYGIRPADAMVLVPMHRGIVGTQNLNHHLQQLLNPTQTERQILHAGTTFKIGDQVMQMRNNYDKLIFNGDMGTIKEIDMQERTLHIQYLEHLVTYDFSELNELALAYAISIHKSQGSEYAAVIVPIFMQPYFNEI